MSTTAANSAAAANCRVDGQRPQVTSDGRSVELAGVEVVPHAAR
jgi:hypothetical protein